MSKGNPVVSTTNINASELDGTAPIDTSISAAAQRELPDPCRCKVIHGDVHTGAAVVQMGAELTLRRKQAIELRDAGTIEILEG